MGTPYFLTTRPTNLPIIRSPKIIYGLCAMRLRKEVYPWFSLKHLTSADASLLRVGL